jgi:hypothetical protein
MTPDQICEAVTDQIMPLEYEVHSLWASAFGLHELIRKARPAEIESVRKEALQVADMIRSYFEVIN